MRVAKERIRSTNTEEYIKFKKEKKKKKKKKKEAAAGSV